jgi:hypothetical protein
MLAVLLGELLVPEIVNKRMISFLGVRGETEIETERVVGRSRKYYNSKFRWEACWS